MFVTILAFIEIVIPGYLLTLYRFSNFKGKTRVQMEQAGGTASRTEASTMPDQLDVLPQSQLTQEEVATGCMLWACLWTEKHNYFLGAMVGYFVYFIMVDTPVFFGIYSVF